MDRFRNARAVSLRSHRYPYKYLCAADDEDSVTLDRSGSSNNACWTVEFVGGSDSKIRLKSCYGKYLTASNRPFLVGITGRKVLQTSPSGRLDSSLEWEPIEEGISQVKLKTRCGEFLRANGGLPPWRNSVTHGIPLRPYRLDRIIWHVSIVEIIPQSHQSNLPPIPAVLRSDSLASESISPSTHSSNSASFGRQESSDSLDTLPTTVVDGRTIYYHIADDYGNVDEEVEGHCMTFRGNEVDELTRTLEEETGLQGIIVCSRSPLDGKLYPLRLHLPPNMTMNVVVVESSSRAARDFAKTGIPL